MRKATDAEKSEYLRQIPKPTYPLYGFVTVKDDKGKRHTCAIEDLRGVWGGDDPKYEVMAPKGFHFADDVVHSLLCLTLYDVRSRVKQTLVPCHAECGGLE